MEDSSGAGWGDGEWQWLSNGEVQKEGTLSANGYDGDGDGSYADTGMTLCTFLGSFCYELVVTTTQTTSSYYLQLPPSSDLLVSDAGIVSQTHSVFCNPTMLPIAAPTSAPTAEATPQPTPEPTEAPFPVPTPKPTWPPPVLWPTPGAAEEEDDFVGVLVWIGCLFLCCCMCGGIFHFSKKGDAAVKPMRSRDVDDQEPSWSPGMSYPHAQQPPPQQPHAPQQPPQQQNWVQQQPQQPAVQYQQQQPGMQYQQQPGMQYQQQQPQPGMQQQQQQQQQQQPGGGARYA